MCIYPCLDLQARLAPTLGQNMLDRLPPISSMQGHKPHSTSGQVTLQHAPGCMMRLCNLYMKLSAVIHQQSRVCDWRIQQLQSSVKPVTFLAIYMQQLCTNTWQCMSCVSSTTVLHAAACRCMMTCLFRGCGQRHQPDMDSSHITSHGWVLTQLTMYLT